MRGVLAPVELIGRQVLAAYRDAPRTARAHVAVRWRTCPFPEVLAELPAEGRVLEVGCGHGLVALACALGAGAVEVVGSDVDAAKLEVARCAAGAAGVADRAHFLVDPAGVLPAGPWSAVVVVDVLYLLAPDDQRRLLADCAAALEPGGVLVVKEMDDRPRWKARWNRIQETVSVRGLHITAGSSLHLLPAETLAGWMGAAGLEVHHRCLDAGYPHPHHLLVGRRP